MTRVVVLPADETACGFYRLREPARVVAEARPDWEVEVYKPSDVILGLDDQGTLRGLYGIPDPPEIDLLVMQRVGTSSQVQLLRWAQTQGIATVVDSDDAMWCIDKENTAWKAWNGSNTKAHWRYLDMAMEIADLSTVTTSYLARHYGKHARVEILPNYVPDSLFDVPSHLAESGAPGLGWAGFTATHPNDLKVCQDAISQALDTFPGARVTVIGDAEGAARDWRLGSGVIEEIPPAGIGDPYYEALTRLGMGVVPLRDTKFNRGKSWLKALEMSAVGLPVIATDLPEFRLLARSLPITLVNSPAQWLTAISEAWADWDATRQRGLYASHVVSKEFTYEANAERWAAAWERAMKRGAALKTYRAKASVG